MKHIYAFLFLLLGYSISLAQSTHSYPEVYLRGGDSDWAITDKYKFSRENNVYTLVITEQNPITQEFKIADANWDFDFGGASKEISINKAKILTLKKAGENLKTNGIESGTISFVYNGDSETLEVNFDVVGDGSDDYQPWSGSLPVMHINVYTDKAHSALNNEIIDYNLPHKDYFQYAEYWLDTNGCKWLEDLGAESVGSEEKPLDLQIKARGNWTRIGFSKKPFKLKLDKKQNLLGLTPAKSKHYALLAHADDQMGYLRNFSMFNLGQRIGLPWTPKAQPVEVVINGDYRGLYFLTESIRVGDGRVEIEELGDNVSDAEQVSGGYIVELDNYDEDNQIRLEENYNRNVFGHYDHWWDALRITWDTPEQYSDLQKKFVTDQFTAINNAVGNNDDILWRYLDIDDAARYYLVNEIISHTESYHGSTYLFRDRGEGQKWHFSPLWDAGNAFNGDTNNFFYNCDPFGNTWIPSMRANHKFNEKVSDTWKWFMSREFEGFFDDMKEFTDNLKKAAAADHERWKNARVPDNNGQPVADNRNIDEKLNQVKNHITQKINWLATIFGSFDSGVYSEPDRDTTPAMELPEYARSAVDSMVDDDSDAPAQYFTLQGLKVENPQPGNLYIVRKGNRSYKVIFR